MNNETNREEDNEEKNKYPSYRAEILVTQAYLLANLQQFEKPK